MLLPKCSYQQSALTKMTARTMGSFQGLDHKTNLLGETLPNKSPRWILHFSNYLIIDLFICKPYNYWILLLF